MGLADLQAEWGLPGGLEWTTWVAAGCFVFGCAAKFNMIDHFDTRPAEAKAAALSKETTTGKRPWWRSGGMHLTELGAIFTILLPMYFFASEAIPGHPRATVALVAGAVCMFVHSLRTVTGSFFASIVLPWYHVSLPLGLMLPLSSAGFAACVGVTFVMMVFKIGVCMSVCLHRFAAHGAFKCSPSSSFALGVLGCLANQGGPIWWASQHRCHHKYCEEERDPHSPIVAGVVGAFTFFERNKDVNEEFSPVHIDSLPMRVLDTFASFPVMVEMFLAYQCFGAAGLWCSYVSAWLSQVVSLWFNIVNHPPVGDEAHNHAHSDAHTAAAAKAKAASGAEVPDACSASDVRPVKPVWPNLVFRHIDAYCAIVPPLVGESCHKHHHDHLMLAQRPGLDLPYFYFVRPLEALGIIWNVKAMNTRKVD